MRISGACTRGPAEDAHIQVSVPLPEGIAHALGRPDCTEVPPLLHDYRVSLTGYIRMSPERPAFRPTLQVLEAIRPVLRSGIPRSRGAFFRPFAMFND